MLVPSIRRSQTIFVEVDWAETVRGLFVAAPVTAGHLVFTGEPDVDMAPPRPPHHVGREIRSR
jgi:hypothetical protein